MGRRGSGPGGGLFDLAGAPAWCWLVPWPPGTAGEREHVYDHRCRAISWLVGPVAAPALVHHQGRDLHRALPLRAGGQPHDQEAGAAAGARAERVVSRAPRRYGFIPRKPPSIRARVTHPGGGCVPAAGRGRVADPTVRAAGRASPEGPWGPARSRTPPSGPQRAPGNRCHRWTKNGRKRPGCHRQVR